MDINKDIKLGIYGNVKIELDGVEIWRGHNLWTNSGLDYMTKRLVGYTSYGNRFRYISFGTGTFPPESGDKTLENEIYRDAISDASSGGQDFTAYYDAPLTSDLDGQEFTEAGLWTESGILLARIVFPAIKKEGTSILRITWKTGFRGNVLTNTGRDAFGEMLNPSLADTYDDVSVLLIAVGGSDEEYDNPFELEALEDTLHVVSVTQLYRPGDEFKICASGYIPRGTLTGSTLREVGLFFSNGQMISRFITDDIEVEEKTDLRYNFNITLEAIDVNDPDNEIFDFDLKIEAVIY